MKHATEEYELRIRPMTKQELIMARDEKGYVEGVVYVLLDDIPGKDYLEFLRFIAGKLIGEQLMDDMSYKVVGFSDEIGLHIKLRGNAL